MVAIASGMVLTRDMNTFVRAPLRTAVFTVPRSVWNFRKDSLEGAKSLRQVCISSLSGNSLTKLSGECCQIVRFSAGVES